jgi:hypothetical protein
MLVHFSCHALRAFFKPVASDQNSFYIQYIRKRCNMFIQKKDIILFHQQKIPERVLVLENWLSEFGYFVNHTRNKERAS